MPCSVAKAAKLKSFMDHICDVLLEYEEDSLWKYVCTYNNWDCPNDIKEIQDYNNIKF